jgi:hypothetical protein
VEEPRAVAVLVRNGRRVELGPVDGTGACDLAVVDDLLRLQLLTARFGWQLRLVHVHPDLRELFELVGMTNHLEEDPPWPPPQPLPH